MNKALMTKIIAAEIGNDRFGNGLKHHPKSIELMNFLKTVDMEVYGSSFDWRTGGDGDNGETLMYQMDAYFEAEDNNSII